MLIGIDNILDKELYQNILQGELVETLNDYCLDQNKVVFQHDNGPKHTAKGVQKWLSTQKFTVMKWPAQILDLNSIEDMWAILKSRLNKYERALNGMLELFERVTDEWYNITAEECQKVTKTMSQRCQEVIKAKGGWTHYLV